MHPAFLKYYAAAVCVFAFVLLLVNLLAAGVMLWYIANPMVTTLQDFRYETAASPALSLGLKDENKHIFHNIDMEDFMKRPEYYYAIAKADNAVKFPELATRTFAFSLIFFALLLAHWRLYKKMRGVGG